jgi:hypothetical protein
MVEATIEAIYRGNLRPSDSGVVCPFEHDVARESVMRTGAGAKLYGRNEETLLFDGRLFLSALVWYNGCFRFEERDAVI